MSWLQFISELVSALAWPVATVLIVLLFKRQILLLIPELRRLRFKELELEFRESVREAEKAIEVAKPAPPPLQAQQDRQSHLFSLATDAPRAAVLEAWIDVETAAIESRRRRADDKFFDTLRRVPLSSELVELGVLPKELRTAYDRLRSLRNRLAHAQGEPITTDQAIDYINVAQNLVRHLSAA